MSTNLLTHTHGCRSQLRRSVPLILVLSFSLFGCSSIKTPDVVKNLSLPSFEIPENDPSFRKRLYAGGSVGQSTLKPDTSGTIFDVADGSDSSSQFRLGIDLHNKLSVELDTAVLGKATFSQGAGTDVSYTSASINALIYGLTGVKNRSRREGFSGYGKIGYGLVQHGSIVQPFDYSDKSILLGVGAEYGFKNGFALRADITRVDADATVMALGGIYRFDMAPQSIGQIFIDAAKPALGAANSRTEVRNGKVVKISSERGKNYQSSTMSPSVGVSNWAPKVSKRDLDGDGVLNAADKCKNTGSQITVGSDGCGMFDAVLSEVTFKSGSSWLTPKARGSLDALAVTLLAFPEARVQVRAHTDSTGPADLNLGLSARRAESVVTYLTAKGISELQLEALGLGESQPIDLNDSKSSKQRNRRIELMTLANIDAQKFTASLPMLGAANASTESQNKPTVVVVKAINPAFAEPVFPPMSGVKIEPLPKSAFVAGLSLGGILEGVDFLDGSANLTNESKPRLQSVGQKLMQFPEVHLVVMGHTDDQRPPEESKSLSTKRATAVVDFLILTGIDATRLSAEGFGSNLPLAQNVTDSDRQRNRRIELRVIK